MVKSATAMGDGDGDSSRSDVDAAAAVAIAGRRRKQCGGACVCSTPVERVDRAVSLLLSLTHGMG